MVPMALFLASTICALASARSWKERKRHDDAGWRIDGYDVWIDLAPFFCWLIGTLLLTFSWVVASTAPNEERINRQLREVEARVRFMKMGPSVRRYETWKAKQ